MQTLQSHALRNPTLHATQHCTNFRDFSSQDFTWLTSHGFADFTCFTCAIQLALSPIQYFTYFTYFASPREMGHSGYVYIAGHSTFVISLKTYESPFDIR